MLEIILFHLSIIIHVRFITERIINIILLWKVITGLLVIKYIHFSWNLEKNLVLIFFGMEDKKILE